MTFREPAPRPIVLRSAAAQSIAAEAAASADGLETGGLLLGHVHDDHVEVRYAGGPGLAAHRSSDRFNRDLEYATALAEAAWQLDRSVWLGEWHTHLAFGPAPSALDLSTYAGHMRDPDLELPCFTALIVTPGPGLGWDRTVATAWSCTATACQAAPLAVQSDTAGPPGPTRPLAFKTQESTP